MRIVCALMVSSAWQCGNLQFISSSGRFRPRGPARQARTRGGGLIPRLVIRGLHRVKFVTIITGIGGNREAGVHRIVPSMHHEVVVEENEFIGNRHGENNLGSNANDLLRAGRLQHGVENTVDAQVALHRAGGVAVLANSVG